SSPASRASCTPSEPRRTSWSRCESLWQASRVPAAQLEADMPKYVILADHSPDICPSANARSRARALQGMGELLPKLAQEAKVTFEVGPLHLDPGHRTIAVVEAPSVEAVAQLVYDTGLSQWNTVEVCPTRTVQALIEAIDDFPIVYD